MIKARIRKPIASPDHAAMAVLSPLRHVSQILGVRVYDVGQGDAIGVLGEVKGREKIVLQFDYGGRQGNPFTDGDEIDRRMPVARKQLLMLSHWDEDHWCSARKGMAAQGADWLVPRQVTSPRAAVFAATLSNVRCIPETLVGQQLEFRAPNQDYVLYEKIGAFAGAFAKDEDCNRTGVAVAVVRRTPNGAEAILLPGDAPFDKVRIFARLKGAGVRLRGIVAFHHGAGTHWSQATNDLLVQWRKCGRFDVIFSCSDPNSYDHPDKDRYERLLPGAICRSTADAGAAGEEYLDLIF